MELGDTASVPSAYGILEKEMKNKGGLREFLGGM